MERYTLSFLVGGAMLASVVLFPVVVVAGAYYISTLVYRFHKGYTEEMEKIRAEENSREQARNREQQEDRVIRACFSNKSWQKKFQGSRGVHQGS